MAKVEFKEERCKGCGLCTIVCPEDIIALAARINKMGYHPAEVKEMDKCTGCTLCAGFVLIALSRSIDRRRLLIMREIKF